MALHLTSCSVCAETFEATRRDAETCSGRCRERRRKARAASSVAAEIDRATALLALVPALVRQ